MSEPIDRRIFLKTASVLTMGAVASKLFGFSPRDKKPNLLFLWTDQQRFDTLAVYGNKKIRMPNLNKFAGESIVFRNAYVTQPVCTPSRACVMTGLWPHQSGLIGNNISLPPRTKCFPEIIDEPEYSTGYFGKWHLGDEIFPQHGFREWVSIEDGYTENYSEGKDKSARSSYDAFLIKNGYEHDKGGKFSRQFVSTLPFEHSKTKFLELSAKDFLDRHKKEPFMLYVNFLEPHTPHNGPFNNMYNPDDLDLPENLNCPLTENDPLRYRKKAEVDSKKSKEGWKKINAKYAALCTQVDMAVGGILDKLDELGLKENTIVVYTSDHGEMMGSHGLYNKTVMYREAVNVPWLIRFPAYSQKQMLVDQNVSHIDLVPTLLDLIGKKKPEDLSGKSLLPLIEGRVKDNGDVFIEWNSTAFENDEDETKGKSKNKFTEDYDKACIRTIVTQDGWKLSLSDLDKSQLFNLETDPGECKNLFADKTYEQVTLKLRDKIIRWQNMVGDDVKI